MKKTIFILLFFVSGFAWSKVKTIVDTTSVPVVGHPCPDVFFDKTLNFNKPSFYLHELKGKWVVLDFWDQGCSSCIARFPHTSELQTQFKDKVQILMVTYDDFKGNNRQIYTHYNNMLHLQMPCVLNGTEDIKLKRTGVFEHFKINGLPFTVIIDPSGIVKVITHALSKDLIQDLIDGKPPVFEDVSVAAKAANGKTKIPYDRSVPFLINGNGGSARSDYLFHSALSHWNPGVTKAADFHFYFPPYCSSGSDIREDLFGRLEMMKSSLGDLYQTAYFGGFNTRQLDKLYPGVPIWLNPILQIKDSSLFSYNWVSGKNLFCYSAVVPPEKCTKEFMLSVMQNDLHNYFGYRASIEMRKMPCYLLVISDAGLANNLKTKGGKAEVEETVRRLGYKATNIPMDQFFTAIEGYAGSPQPFIDETGIKTNVDFAFEAPYGSLEGTNKALEKLGLKIVKVEKEMKVLVIRDPELVRAQMGAK